MQKEISNNLQLTIAKLELKQLEFIDKVSKRNNKDYIIRCITDPIERRFIAVNGDWEKVTGYDESFCIGKEWSEFIPDESVENVISDTKGMIDEDGEFDSFVCDVITITGKPIKVTWKAKFYPEINSVVAIGRVKK